ncbi:MAG: flagellar biosynthesis anti-sigma factor FlgM [Deltaproteobacteria bacterium CG11_big_fil_rev_8_21_14_0_20_45_16]|nr:MAG: flagellar biosynthesis anti-sigma factor FlgM [Deltaproteobacteria bacterium CG11_big_fil_rev_8_21_14_0_20_45_16]
MKIDGLKPGKSSITKKSDKSKSASSKRPAAGSVADRATAAGANSGSGDEVSVGAYSEALEMIRGMVDQTPDVRMEEVDRIVNELKTGRFKIDFEKIAEGFLKEAIMTEMAKKKSMRAKS